jgi:hypothetical protein
MESFKYTTPQYAVYTECSDPASALISPTQVTVIPALKAQLPLI